MFLLIGLRADAAVAWHDGVLTITHGVRRPGRARADPGIADLIGELPGALADEDDLAERLLRAGGTSQETALLYLVLDRLHAVLVHTVEPMLRVTPIARDAAFRLPDLAPDDTSAPRRGSRWSGAPDDGLVLESPLSRHRVTLTEEAMPLIAALAGGVMVKEEPEALAHLVAAGLADGDEDDPPRAARLGVPRPALPQPVAGGPARPAGRRHLPLRSPRTPPEPALEPVPEGAGSPSCSALRSTSPVRRSPRSWRDAGRCAPVRRGAPTLRQLGELLYRVAGSGTSSPSRRPARRTRPAAAPTPAAAPATSWSSTSPSTGARALEGGVYYYDPLGHRLVTAARQGRGRAGDADHGGHVDRLHRAAGRPGHHDLARSSACRGSTAGLAYAASLKNVGVLYQSLLPRWPPRWACRPCGLGAATPTCAARTFGLDWATESSVGEFLIGGSPGLAMSVSRRLGDLHLPALSPEFRIVAGRDHVPTNMRSV